MADEKPDDQSSAGRALARMVDLRVPLPWLLTGVGALLWVVISMWFSLAQIKNDMSDLKASIIVATATAGKMQLLEFRLQTVESDLSQLKNGKPR